MPETFTFEEAAPVRESFSFEQANSFSFEEAKAPKKGILESLGKSREQIAGELQSARLSSGMAGAAESAAGAGWAVAKMVDVFGSLRYLGDIAAGFASDVIQGSAQISPSGNLPTLPRTAAAIVQEPADVPSAAMTPIQAGIVEGARGVPTVMAGAALQAVGVPAPLAYGLPVGGQTLVETGDPQQALIAGGTAAVLPSVAGAARNVSTKVLSEVVKSGALSAGGAELVTGASEMAAIAAYNEVAKLPAYATMTPDERGKALQESLGHNLAFVPMVVGGALKARPARPDAPLEQVAAKAEETKAPATAEALKNQEQLLGVARPEILEAEVVGETRPGPAIPAPPAPLDVGPVAEAPVGPRKLWVDPYTTPMLERLDTLGGKASRAMADAARQVDAISVTLAGQISPLVDKARSLASKAFRGGTTWIRGEAERPTPDTMISRLHTLEGLDRDAVVAKAPEEAKPLVEAFWDANVTGIGGLAEQAAVGFVKQGGVQRILTPRGMDIVLEGGGKLWDRLVEGNAKANDVPVEEAKSFFKEWKAVLDDPHPDTARVDSIAQDFQKRFPKAVSHVKSGPAWIEVLVSDPVEYLNAATERTARSAAFRKLFPNTPEGQAALVNLHKQVLSELPTSTRKEEFNNLIKTLQGHRLDTAPERYLGGIPGGQLAADFATALTRPLRAGMLSIANLANVAESVIGGPSIFLKFANTAKLLTENPIRLYKQLEMAGMVNRATRNFAFNPTAPLRSVSRMVSEGIGRATANNFFNEVQEYTGSATAKLFADRVLNRDLSPGEIADFESVLRAMGFRDNYAEIARGNDVEGIAQFERQAAPFLSAGHQRPATSSRWANSRAFNSLFWFHRYPQMVLNQFRGITNNLIEDVQQGNMAHLGRDIKLMTKFIGGKAIQGALATMIVAAVKEGGEGVEQKTREAREDFAAFLKESIINAVGGPLAIMQRVGQRAETGEQAATEVLKASAPISTGIDLYNAATGKGKYAGLDTFDSVAKFIESKTPAIPAVRSAMGVTGLAEDNSKLRTAINAYYRWGRKQGWTWPEGQPSDAKFSQAMRQTVKTMEKGGDWQSEIQKAIDVKAEAGKDPRDAVRQSLDRRKVLRNQHGGQLSPEERDSLRQWLGEENYLLIQQRDAMVDAVADVFKK